MPKTVQEEEEAYSSSNWTVPTLPSTSRVTMYTRCLRSMTSSDDHDRSLAWGPRKYTCNDCKTIFPLKALLVRHRLYECNQKTSSSSAALKQEHRAASGGNSGVGVGGVAVGGDEGGTLEDHGELILVTADHGECRTVRAKKKHACPKCGRSYAFFTSLWRHQNYECGVEPKFVCPICRVKFAQKSNLDRHVRTKH